VTLAEGMQALQAAFQNLHFTLVAVTDTAACAVEARHDGTAAHCSRRDASLLGHLYAHLYAGRS